MIKKIKDFAKNKKGDFAIFAVVIIPVFLMIFTGVLSVSYRSNAIKSKVQTSADNVSIIASKYYASKVTSTGNACYFLTNIFDEGRNDEEEEQSVIVSSSTNAKSGTFEYMFAEYLKTIDGFNDTWRGKITITHGIGGTEVLQLTVFYTFPKIGNNMNVISTYGKAPYSDVSTWSGWYKANPKTWSQMSENINANIKKYDLDNPDAISNNWNKLDNSEVIAGYVISETSCS